MDEIRKKSLPPRSSLMNKNFTPKKHIEIINDKNKKTRNQYLSPSDDDFG